MAKSATTIVGPTGDSTIIEINMPNVVLITEITAEQIVTDLNVLNMRIALSAGKMIKAEINKEPTKVIARTIVTAVTTAIK